MLLPLFAVSQYWELGLTGGGTHLFGDMSNNTFELSGEYGATGGIFVRRALGNKLGLRGNIRFIELSGADENIDATASRGFIGRSDNMEASVQAEFFLTGYERAVRPFINLGVGYLFTQSHAGFNINNTVNNNIGLLTNIRNDRNVDNPVHSLVIPWGIGVDFRVNANRPFHIGVEVGGRPTTTDYLDGISLAADPDDKDWFGVGQINVSWPIGSMAPDTDGDGIKDEVDACPTIPGLEAMNGCPDSDGDGLTDADDDCPNVAGLAMLQGCPDSDGDGVANNNDDCPNTAGSPDTNGCPDADNDGIKDSDDDCPNERGLLSLGGCPDADRDGIADKDDECPNEQGRAANNGCPVADSDNDGVNDEEDNCPDEAGTAANKGCPDSDNDGIIDGDDACPNVAGTVSGCPDGDNDGIADKDDKCPTLGTNVDANGCPKIEAKTTEVFSRAMRGIQFETSSDRIKNSSISILNEVVAIMKANPGYKLNIAGHTDSVGDAAKNQSLSQRRATSVMNYLVQNGVDGLRMSAVGYGEEYPIADNDTREGRQQNRRVELTARY